MQADELSANVDEQYQLLIRDYSVDPTLRFGLAVKMRLRDLPLERLLEPDAVAHELGLASSDRSEQHLRSRGYRVLAQIPALPATVVGRIIERFGSLPMLVRATVGDLDEVDGVGTRRARAIANGLSSIRTHASL
jgi:diadenylate cyclase